MQYSPHCNMRGNEANCLKTQQQMLHIETAEAVRQYLNTCVLDGFPAHAAGWRLVSAPHRSLFAVRYLNLRHVVCRCLRAMR